MTGRALVVGGTGFLGRHIVTRLVQAGWHMTVAVRRSGTVSPNADEVVIDLESEPREQFTAVLAKVTPELVVNAAGEIWRCDEALMRAANTVLPEHLAMAMNDAGSTSRLVHLGSSLEYHGLFRPAATGENAPTTRGTGYGRSKLHGTKAVLRLGRVRSGGTVVLRVFNAIGAGMSESSLPGRVVRALADARRTGDTAVIRLTDLAQYRDYVDARDVADAVLAAATCDSAVLAPIVNVGSAVARSADEVVRAFADVSRVGYRISRPLAGEADTASRSAHVGWQVADTSLAARSLAWSAARGLQETVRWIWRSECTRDRVGVPGAEGG